jgi:hypothetical protein
MLPGHFSSERAGVGGRDDGEERADALKEDGAKEDTKPRRNEARND